MELGVFFFTFVVCFRVAEGYECLYGSSIRGISTLTVNGNEAMSTSTIN